MRKSSFSRRRRSAPPSEPVFTQDQLRERRRRRHLLAYTGAFSLSAEITAICAPLAQRVGALPRPIGARRRVEDLADACHEAVSMVARWCAESDALVKTGHLSAYPGRRAVEMRGIVDVAPSPVLPEITDEMIVNGLWVAALTRMADPYTAPWSDLLGRSYPPDAFELRGTPSRSERLERLLREGVDAAALMLQRFCEAKERDHRDARRARPEPIEVF